MQMQAQALFRENMERKLAKRPWIAEKRTHLGPPAFASASRALTFRSGTSYSRLSGGM